MNDEPAVVVDDVDKSFILPHQKVNSIKTIFTSLGFFRRGKYETQHALKDISFTINKGEFFGIVGRNGSGKSTLLKLIAGIYQPSNGSITVNGKIVPFIELGVGFNPELSGRDNVYLNGAMLGFSDKEIDLKYDAIVDFAELERFMDQKLKNYSSGMQVRLAFSVATILAESDVLLLDEVLAVGDADFQRKCYKYFKNLKKMNKTVVFVTHDMNAVREYCDRALLINKSRIVQIGNPEDIAGEYTKLFSSKSRNDQSTESGNDRWGDGRVIYKKISIDKDSSNKSEIRIKLEVKATKSTDDPVYGFLIRDEGGQVLFGTNTKILKKQTEPIKKGQTHAFSWTIPNIFNSGTYEFTPSIIHNNTMDVSDWWTCATTINIESETSTPYPVNPKIEFESTQK